MKNCHLIHLAWALFAAAAFTMGNRTRDTESGTAGQFDNKGVASFSSRTKTSPSGRRSASGFHLNATSTPLSDFQVRQLCSDCKFAKDPIKRRQLFTEVLANLTPENALLIREENILDFDEDSSEFRDFLYTWGSIVGDDADISQISETAKGNISSFFAGWASKSPEAALAYHEGFNRESKLASSVRWGILAGLLKVRVADLKSDSSFANSASGHFNPSAAMRFVASLQETGFGFSPYAGLITKRVLSSGEPAAAAAIANWAATLPFGEYFRDLPVSEVFKAWAINAPSAAREQLASIKPSPERDQAIFGYVLASASADPQLAIQWANKVSDNLARVELLSIAGRAFYKEDREAAKQWIPNSGLSENEIGSMLMWLN